MLESIFFHPLSWDNDMYYVYVAWGIIALFSFWFVRFLHKSFRQKNMKYKDGIYYFCRDIFMCLNGYEYLIFVVLLLASYLGLWAYYVNPSKADWSNYQTYMVILPQLIVLLTTITLFFFRYIKFRKPYIK